MYEDEDNDGRFPDESPGSALSGGQRDRHRAGQRHAAAPG